MNQCADVGDDGDYLDVDLVEFHDEDFRDITTILKLSDTMKDKLTFTVSWLLKVDLTRIVNLLHTGIQGVTSAII